MFVQGAGRLGSGDSDEAAMDEAVEGLDPDSQFWRHLRWPTVGPSFGNLLEGRFLKLLGFCGNVWDLFGASGITPQLVIVEA